MELCREYRSASQQMNYLSVGRVEVVSEMPLGEVLFDFYGKLKTVTRGYGSFDYVTNRLSRDRRGQGRNPD